MKAFLFSLVFSAVSIAGVNVGVSKNNQTLTSEITHKLNDLIVKLNSGSAIEKANTIKKSPKLEERQFS